MLQMYHLNVSKVELPRALVMPKIKTTVGISPHSLLRKKNFHKKAYSVLFGDAN
jgi:hypothetical protein